MSSPSEAPAAGPVLDFIGREITASATIVYPVRRGSSMWLNRLKVTQVVGGPSPTVTGFNDTGRRITLHNIQTVVVVEPLPTPAV